VSRDRARSAARNRGSILVAAAALLAASSACRPRATAPLEPALRFLKNGEQVARFGLRELQGIAPPATVSAFDPYYGKDKTFRALPLRPILARAFPGQRVADAEWILRARDGFTVPLRGAILDEEGAYLAIAEAAGRFEPIGPKQVDPGPFYLVWQRPDQLDPATHPRPWQLESFDVARFEDRFPHTVPPDGGGAAVARGFALFRAECLPCHAINREGGRIGPDLNVPRSVIEYRPVEQVRAYIKDPLAFRYGNMPAHPKFTDENLDDLVAYLTAMKDRKHDPERR
jgi:mono/diheme cytochrome c family protein